MVQIPADPEAYLSDQKPDQRFVGSLQQFPDHKSWLAGASDVEIVSVWLVYVGIDNWTYLICDVPWQEGERMDLIKIHALGSAGMNKLLLRPRGDDTRSTHKYNRPTQAIEIFERKGFRPSASREWSNHTKCFFQRPNLGSPSQLHTTSNFCQSSDILSPHLHPACRLLLSFPTIERTPKCGILFGIHFHSWSRAEPQCECGCHLDLGCVWMILNDYT